MAALIGAARAIGPHDDVCYVAFDGEECGFVGSRAVVAGLGQYRPEQVHILEMVGYARRRTGLQRNPIAHMQSPTVGDFIALVGTFGSLDMLEHVLATANCHAVPVQGLFLPNVPLEMIGRVSNHVLRSDHTPFWLEGIPALDVDRHRRVSETRTTIAPPTRRRHSTTSSWPGSRGYWCTR